MPEAEFTPERARQLLSSFLPFYNEIHGTSFTPDDLRKSDDQSCDYYLRDKSGRDLKLQWTAAATEPRERVAPKQAEEFLTFFEEWLRRYEVRGVQVMISFKDLPSDSERKRKIAYALAYLVREKAKSTREDMLFEYDEQDWQYPMADLSRYCSQIVIRCSSDPMALPVLYCSSMGVREMLPSDNRARRALDKKIRKYSAQAHDLTLVIHYDTAPYSHDAELEWIRSLVQEDPGAFEEVWIFRHTAIPLPRADRVYFRQDAPSESTGEMESEGPG